MAHRREGNFDRRTVLVTGASRGLGRAIALTFAERRAALLLVGRDLDSLAAVQAEVEGLGGTAICLACDLRDPASVLGLPSQLRDHPRLDVLIGNAGVLGPQGRLAEIDVEAWDETFTVNVAANLLLVQAFWMLLKRSESARILFVTSGAARGVPTTGAYSASKAALNAMALGLSQEVEPPRMTVNLVSPGPLRTAMRRQAKPDEPHESVPIPASVARIFLDLADPGCSRNGEIVMQSKPR